MRKLVKRKLRRAMWSLACLVAAGIFYGGIQFLPSSTPQTPDGELAVHFIDVGQGDAILLSCDGETAIVDAGTPQCEEDLLSYLQSQNIGKPKYIFATHPHADHIGSMAAVVDTFGCENFIMPEMVSYTQTFENMLSSVEQAGCQTAYGVAGDTFTLGDAQLKLLWPTEGFDTSDPNEISLVLQVTYGEYSFLLTGDAGKDAEEGFLSQVQPVTVLKAGHHGSDTSSTEAFLQKAQPEYVVISVGAGNSYGHPSPAMLERLDENCQVLRTDEKGSIVFTVKEGELRVSTAR